MHYIRISYFVKPQQQTKTNLEAVLLKVPPLRWGQKLADVYARSERPLIGAWRGFEVSMLSAALLAAGRFVSAALYVVNIFA